MAWTVINDEGNYYLRCLRCVNTHEAPASPLDDGDAGTDETYAMACRLCERYYAKGRLFLNNVG